MSQKFTPGARYGAPYPHGSNDQGARYGVPFPDAVSSPGSPAPPVHVRISCGRADECTVAENERTQHMQMCDGPTHSTNFALFLCSLVFF